MDDDTRELANRLFAMATAMLEDVIEIAVAGQSPRLDPSQLSAPSSDSETSCGSASKVGLK